MVDSLRNTISWTLAVLSIGYCVHSLADLGSVPTPRSHLFRSTSILLSVCLPLLASFVALRSRKRAAAFWLIASFVAIGWVASAKTSSIPFEISLAEAHISRLFVNIAVLSIVNGLFWFVTDRHKWSPVVSNPITFPWKVALVLVSLLAVSIESVLMDLYAHDVGECHFAPQPFYKQQSPEQASFTARVVWTGMLWPEKRAAQQSPWSPKKYWALAIVQKHFWGLPWWDHKVAILTAVTNDVTEPFQHGESYLIDGRRSLGSITRFLPIRATFCTRSKKLRDAQLDLRILRDGGERDRVRIVGHTVRRTSKNTWEDVSGITVVAQGSSAKGVAVSDENGIYDIGGLPPGEYNVGLQTASGKIIWQNAPDCMLYRWQQSLRPGDVRDCTVTVK